MSNRLGPRTRLLGSVGSALVCAWLRRSPIRSVQRGTIAISNVQTSNTAAITSVNTANSLLRYLNYNASPTAASIREDNLLLTFTSATVITASHDTAGNDITAGFQVTEYWPGIIRKVQRGTITITNGNTSNTATLSGFQNLQKMEITFLGQTYTGTTATNFRALLALTNLTTVTLTKIGNADDVTVGFEVVEWY